MIFYLFVRICRNFLLLTGRYGVIPALLVLMLGGWGCAVRRRIHVSHPQAPGPLKQATTKELVRKVDSWSGDIETLTATVEFRPTTGSVYNGVINEYHKVGGFILLKKPAMIHIIGQAPVVRTDIFDMVSDGQQFRVSIPPKNKFIIGDNSYHGSAKKPLENLRPDHIMDALLIPPIDKAKEKFFDEQTHTPEGQFYYVLNVVEPTADGELNLKRKVWFNRTDLNISRLQLYGPEGALVEDVNYADYRDFQGIRYPAQINLSRPEQDYTLAITIAKATFNKPIPAKDFILKRPPNATVVKLGGGE